MNRCELCGGLQITDTAYRAASYILPRCGRNSDIRAVFRREVSVLRPPCFRFVSVMHSLCSLYIRNTSSIHSLLSVLFPLHSQYIRHDFTNFTLLGGLFAAIRCHSLYILNTLFIYPYVIRFIFFHNYGKNAFLSISITDDNEFPDSMGTAIRSSSFF